MELRETQLREEEEQQQQKQHIISSTGIGGCVGGVVKISQKEFIKMFNSQIGGGTVSLIVLFICYFYDLFVVVCFFIFFICYFFVIHSFVTTLYLYIMIVCLFVCFYQF